MSFYRSENVENALAEKAESGFIGAGKRLSCRLIRLQLHLGSVVGEFTQF
jgi:hypothetical protein